MDKELKEKMLYTFYHNLEYDWEEFDVYTFEDFIKYYNETDKETIIYDLVYNLAHKVGYIEWLWEIER